MLDIWRGYEKYKLKVELIQISQTFLILETHHIIDISIAIRKLIPINLDIRYYSKRAYLYSY